MSYASLQDLIDRVGENELMQLTDRANSPEAGIDADIVEAALAEADRRIDAYLGVRYATPLSTVPAIVRSWAIAIARYTLHSIDPPENVVRDNKDALAELRDAAAGRLALPDLEGDQPTQSADGGTVAEGSEPVFTRDNLGGWL